MAPGSRWATLIPIRNMNRAIRFYTRTLGGRLRDRGDGAMRNFWASLTLGGCEIWLVAPQRREPRRLAYSALLVRNIRTYVRTLQRKRVRFERAERMGPETRIDGPIAFDRFGASAFFKDPEGNLLMIWQAAPSS